MMEFQYVVFETHVQYFIINFIIMNFKLKQFFNFKVTCFSIIVYIFPGSRMLMNISKKPNPFNNTQIVIIQLL
jgi:hypothetical protein